MAIKRAMVLLAIHVLMAIHIAHWLWKGSTLTPLEPSEAMQFSKQGLVNAGLIFFALAILSVLVVGRYFCGWGVTCSPCRTLADGCWAKSTSDPSRCDRASYFGHRFWRFYTCSFCRWLSGRWLVKASR